MGQGAREAPAGRGRSTTPPATGMGLWESPSPRQMHTHAPFPSLSSYAGAFVGGAGTTFGAAHLSPAAADSRLPSQNVPDHAWNQSAPSPGGPVASGYRGNFLSLLEARSVAPEMFGDVAAACDDYLAGVGAATPAAGGNITGAAAAAYGLSTGSIDRYSAAAGVPPARHETASSPLVYSGNSVATHGSIVDCAPCCDHGVEGASQQQGFGAPTAAFLQQVVIPGRVEIQSGLGYGGMGSERATESSAFGVGSLPDTGSFGDYRSATEFMSSNNNRHEKDMKPGMGSSSSSRGAASVATTRRKSELRAGGNTKKSKQEASRKASPPKPQAPKVKLGQKITALQEIVSPFGKTDTASVLLETIKYIKFLHEQLRLFSEPYMTKRGFKGHIQFGGDEKEEKTGTGHGLEGRGLCLVPVSLASQVYQDDALPLPVPDCWTPAYRSCLYG